MTTAFVLSGAGSLGAVQVGMLQALADEGIAPDLLIGTSAGALNAAYVAGHGSSREAIDTLANVWTSLHGMQIFRPDPARALRAATGSATSVFSDHGLRRLLQRHLTFARLEQAPITLQVVASDLLSGQEVPLAYGDAVEAVLASSAIPGVFPPVTWEGRTLVDGALADNTAISRAVLAGADRVYVLPSGYACALREPPRSALGVATQALSILVQQRLLADIALYADRVSLVVLTPPCPLSVAPMDFSHSAALIARARSDARHRLSRDGGVRRDPVRDIGLHHDPRAAERFSRAAQ